MRIQLSKRRTMIAVAAATVVLGSAAAYAITLPELPELPVKAPGISLDLPIDLPNPLISPPDTQLPANPIVGPPDGDELSDITRTLDPSAAAKRGLEPAAKHPAPAPQTAQDPRGAPGEAAPAGKHSKSLEDFFSDDDWAKWRQGNPEGSISVTIGRGINVCNNNNVKVIVNRDSSGDENTIEQHNERGDIVTTVNGDRTDPADSGISCDH